MQTNYFGVAMFLIVTFVVGFVSLRSPLLVAKMLLWKFNSWDEDLLPNIREARLLIKQNPAEYARRFRAQLIVIRINGSIACAMFMFALTVVLLDIFLD